MIDVTLSAAMDEYNDRSRDALGWGTPGYRPVFNDVLESKVRTIRSFDPMAVASQQDQFFVIDNGDGSHNYTRTGDFKIQAGKVVTAKGLTVLGYAPNDATHSKLIPLTVPSNTPDGQVGIDASGNVRLGVKKDGTGMPKPYGPSVGTIALCRFAPGTVIDNSGKASSGYPLELGTAGQGGLLQLRTGARDQSSVDHLASIYNLANAGTMFNSLLDAESAKENLKKTAAGLIK